MTVGQWLDEWLENDIKPRLTANTYTTYKSVLDQHLKPMLGGYLLQKLTPLHIRHYYSESKLAQRTLTVHHTILTSSLKAAISSGYLRTNVAIQVTNRPRIASSDDVLHNVWNADEASRFLTTVKETMSAQFIAFFALALDSGARKQELLALRWTDIDLATGTLRIERQLLGRDQNGLVTSLPKGKRARTLDLSDETVKLLKEHKSHQSEVKLKNRLHYVDYGLVFAQDWELKSSSRAELGAPMYRMTIDSRLKKLCEAAKVKKITCHGLRHSSATLLLAAGVAPHVVQRRLGHKKVEMTLNIYSHVLPSMQQDAAKRLATLLHG
jgi:integrase